MPRVSYREIHDRFTHIDGEIASAEASASADGTLAARVVLRFYAWWEHPLFQAAVAAKQPWGFVGASEAGARDMVVEAVRPLRCTLHNDRSAIDIAFLTEHPSLWDFEGDQEIFCNSGFERRELVERVLARRLPGVGERELFEHLSPYSKHTAPFSLGYFPRTLHGILRDELLAMGVRLFEPPPPVMKPAPPEPAVALMIDDEIVIIARDFVVDVPEFEHRPEWFQPQGVK